MVAHSNVIFGKRNDEVKVTQAALIAVGISIPRMLLTGQSRSQSRIRC